MHSNLQLNRIVQTPKSPFFQAWVEFVLKYRWILLGISLLCSAILGFIAYRGLTIDNSADALLSSTDPSMVTLQELQYEFGPDRHFMVLAAGDVFTLDYLNRLKQLQQDLSNIDLRLDSLGERETGDKNQESFFNRNRKNVGSRLNQGIEIGDDFVDYDPTGSVMKSDSEGDQERNEASRGAIFDRIISLINLRKTSRENGVLRIEGLLDKWPTEAELPKLEQRVRSDRNLVGQIVGKEGRHSVIVLMTDYINEEDTVRLYQEILRIVDHHQADGFNLSVGGSAAFTAEIDAMILDDFTTFTTLAAVIMVVLMSVVFRHPIGVLGPILVVAQSAIWMLGFMAIAEVPMTMVTNVLPAFLGCVGVGDSVHILSVYRDARIRHMPNREAIIHSIATTGSPIFYTTLTTALGLLSFHLSSLSAIVNMGTFGALGIFIALLYSLVFLPIVLTFNTHSLLGGKAEIQKPDRVDRFLAFCTSLSRVKAADSLAWHHRTWMTLLAALCIFGIACIGVSMLRVYHNPLTWLPKENRVRKATEEFNDNVGGAASVSVLIEAPQGGDLKDRELLLALEKLDRHIKSYKDPETHQPIIGAITSLLDPVRESFQAINENEPTAYRIPDTQAGVNDMFTMFRNLAPDELKHLITIDDTKSLMRIRVNWMDAGSYGALIRHIRSGVDGIIGDRAKVKITGTVITFHRIMAAFATDLIKSFGTASVVITLIMIALLRNIKLGLVAMLPNLLPIVSIMGFMGFASIPLDMSTLLIASIIIGIAVDDTIHFLHQFKMRFGIDNDVEAAIEYAISHTGRAMLCTSTILALGFSIYLSATMYNLQRFGILSALAIVFAFFFDVVFTPALLRTIYGSMSRKQRPILDLNADSANLQLFNVKESRY